jgi:hypothetical protein
MMVITGRVCQVACIVLELLFPVIVQEPVEEFLVVGSRARLLANVREGAPEIRLTRR